MSIYNHEAKTATLNLQNLNTSGALISPPHIFFRGSVKEADRAQEAMTIHQQLELGAAHLCALTP